MAKPVKKSVWSKIDAVGLLNGLGFWDPQYKTLQYVRRPGESVLELKDRILRTHENIPSTTKQGLINGLSNEFNLDPYNTEKKTIFELSNLPIPNGLANEQDVWIYYKINDTWQEVKPQIWSEDYENAKKNYYGFVVWQVNRYNTIPNQKNFTYSNIIEIFEEFLDETEFKFKYYVNMRDEDGVISKVLFTDMQNPNDDKDLRFTYRLPDSGVLGTDIIAYTLNDIPESVSNTYYDSDGIGKPFLYQIKTHLDRKFGHTWDKIKDNTCIWDIASSYGSGHIPSFYDALLPPMLSGYNDTIELSHYYTGGIESYSESLYIKDIVVQDNGTVIQDWYLGVFPGKFYLHGIPYYLFENPTVEYLNLSTGSCSLPSGIERYHHLIMAVSGYYDDAYNDSDIYLSGKIYEDFNYNSGEKQENYYNNIYRKRPYINPLTGPETELSTNQYMVDYDNSIIYGSGINDGMLIWDDIDVPSGVVIEYNINPLKEQNITLEKYFLFLSANEFYRIPTAL